MARVAALVGAMDGTDISEDSSQEDKTERLTVTPKVKSKRFSLAQTVSLKAYYGNGMVGTGKIFDLLIAKAASDTLLTSDQVKVNLRKLRYIYNTILLVNCPKKLRDM